MRIDTESTLIGDVNSSLARAYDAKLPAAVQEQVRTHLSYLLTRFTEPNTLIQPCRDALRVMDARFAARDAWYKRPLGIVMLSLAVAIVGGVVVVYLGYKLRINGADAPPSPPLSTGQAGARP